MPLLSATLLVCESTLKESNGVYSAIRVSDLLNYDLIADLPLERQTVAANILGVLRFSPEDADNHVAELFAMRPDGTEAALGQSPLTLGSLTTPNPNTAKTVYVLVDLMIVPRDGIHRIGLRLDGQQVAAFAFSMARKVTESSEHEPGADPQPTTNQ